MRRRCHWSAASLLAALALAGPAPARAATILERAITIEVRPDGSVTEKRHLRVRLDTDADVSAWSTQYVWLDENRTLESLAAWAVQPDGRKVEVGRRGLDTAETVGYGELHSSRKARVVRFPAVSAGAVLTLDSEVRERPWFPAGEIALTSGDPVEALRVEVRGAGAGWRFRVDGETAGLEIREAAGGVTVTAAHLPRRVPPDLAPEEDGPVLRYAWGDVTGWEGVGRWYDRLVADVPRGAAPVRAKAHELADGVAGKREKIAALLAFVRRQVRYVAIEVGIGGYRPSAPGEVLQRQWGDCKDKAFLLIDLLREAGVEAWPVMILSAERERVDRDFPAPQFNHAIVAVAADGLGLAPEDPVAGGYLFLDATQTQGGLAWLHPGAQGQEALIVRGGQGVLVRTPIRQEREKQRLAVDVAAAADGGLEGTARFDLQGEAGQAFVDLVAAGRPNEVDRAARLVLGKLLPAVKLDDLHWTTDTSGAPAAALTAKVRLAASAPTAPGGWPAFPIPPLSGMPAPGILEERALPVVTSPYTTEISWSVTLAGDACPPAPGQEVKVENALGSYRQTVSWQGSRLTVERRTELRQRWIMPADFAAFKEIALAEARTGKRRLRWECGSGVAAASGSPR
jgi:hypothetical protein